MKICLVTTDEETIFIPKGINYLVEKFNNEIWLFAFQAFQVLKENFIFFFYYTLKNFLKF